LKSENDYNEILSLVTHDLKSPITAILSSFEILSLDDLSDTDKNDAIKQGRKASKSILKLIEDILVMARLEANKESIKPIKICNLEEKFLDIVKTFKYERKLKHIDINLSIDKNIPVVYWDIDKIQYHVINNIISNALKFTPSGGLIQIKISFKNNKVNIHIKDNGIGITKEYLENIFDKYKIVDSNKKSIKGHGLGLYNAYNFVKKHKGTIKTTKGIDGKGAGFCIVLPTDSR
jgi:signal transduction histidine kinase